VTGGEADAAGPARVDDLRCSDELLDRLGRRAPGASDLDDPLVAALAVMAGDIDLNPVPVSASRRALAEAGSWPPHRPPHRELPPPAGSPGWTASPARLTVPKPARPGAPRIVVPARRPVPPAPAPGHPAGLPGVPRDVLGDGTGARHRGSRPRRVSCERIDLLVPRLDHPRVLRMAPALGVAVAALLVVLGSGVAVAVSGVGARPAPGRPTAPRVGGAVQRLSPAALAVQVEAARQALHGGDRVTARKILDGIDGQLAALPAPDRTALIPTLAGVEQALAEPGAG
jgi:hypothetical protein